VTSDARDDQCALARSRQRSGSFLEGAATILRNKKSLAPAEIAAAIATCALQSETHRFECVESLLSGIASNRADQREMVLV